MNHYRSTSLFLLNLNNNFNRKLWTCLNKTNNSNSSNNNNNNNLTNTSLWHNFHFKIKYNSNHSNLIVMVLLYKTHSLSWTTKGLITNLEEEEVIRRIKRVNKREGITLIMKALTKCSKLISSLCPNLNHNNLYHLILLLTKEVKEAKLTKEVDLYKQLTLMNRPSICRLRINSFHTMEWECHLCKEQAWTTCKVKVRYIRRYAYMRFRPNEAWNVSSISLTSPILVLIQSLSTSPLLTINLTISLSASHLASAILPSLELSIQSIWVHA